MGKASPKHQRELVFRLLRFSMRVLRQWWRKSVTKWKDSPTTYLAISDNHPLVCESSVLERSANSLGGVFGAILAGPSALRRRSAAVRAKVRPAHGRCYPFLDLRQERDLGVLDFLAMHGFAFGPNGKRDTGSMQEVLDCIHSLSPPPVRSDVSITL
jgi:hypothetical protein